MMLIACNPYFQD
jgi:hypothetical protein